jgi:hypothetical protein
MSTGLGQADLSVNFRHHEGGLKKQFDWKDFQVASAEFFGTFFLSLIIGKFIWLFSYF